MKQSEKIRYAVVGAGWIAQSVVLPAFRNAGSNSVLAAIVSGDDEKRTSLGRKYGVKSYSYEQYEECLRSGEIDAVYIALPNHLHAEYTERAANTGIHVLVEKPMAVTVEECDRMIQACRDNEVKLMVAYRLHFEKANLEAVEVVASGKLGEPRAFNSFFSMPIQDRNNIRLKREMGGGPLYDLGVYCINAARYLFAEEPYELIAMSGRGDDPRFDEVDEMVSVTLRFPKGKLATFSCSFGSASESHYDVLGTKGTLRLAGSYGYGEEMTRYLTLGKRTQTKTYRKRDQFGPELLYFSECILENRQPEPSGIEGMNDVWIIESIHRSLDLKEAVLLGALPRKERLTRKQEKNKPVLSEPSLVHAKPPQAA